MTNDSEARWNDPDLAVQVEDDNPESLAGVEVEFDEAADDEPAEQEDFPAEGAGPDAGVGNLPAEGA